MENVSGEDSTGGATGIIDEAEVFRRDDCRTPAAAVFPAIAADGDLEAEGGNAAEDDEVCPDGELEFEEEEGGMCELVDGGKIEDRDIY
jgi:hypothetical protein